MSNCEALPGNRNCALYRNVSRTVRLGKSLSACDRKNVCTFILVFLVSIIRSILPYVYKYSKRTL